jgi:hypothetical protein
VHENDDAKTAALVSDVAFGVGAAALVAGVYLLVTGSDAPASVQGVSAQLGPREVGLGFRAAW